MRDRHRGDVLDGDGDGGHVRGSVPAVSRSARGVTALVGFVLYSAGLAALVLFGGLMLAGWARWGMPMPGD